ncbi:sulfatase-like hydrolase/transferase [Candidatus Magnetominusculus dajiuhuensis]|uniref:sulfatase-like hydrolase/transferase n=1 Tax=Candidatus Magnetominusculus dajiuhuensis TaxID=3137712 RepID=UPI003B436D91
MKRRDFLGLTAGAIAGGALLGSSVLTDSGKEAEASTNISATSGNTPPNILVITVDQLRFPVNFPAGITTADQYMARFMPNLYKYLWTGGVKFANHHIAAAACTPSRCSTLTGLYAQQNWVLTTLTGHGNGGNPSPSLNPAFPTYGTLLRQAGYQTPHFGKFHCSIDYPLTASECQAGVTDYLEQYGFTTYVCPDAPGQQGQGNGGDGTIISDQDIANSAISYLSGLTPNSPRWCATVEFVNPHDYEFFWGGTEPNTYNNLFSAAGATPLISYNSSILQESNPTPKGFPVLPENWEPLSQLIANKPKAQHMFNECSQAIFSGISFDPSDTTFKLADSPIALGKVKKGVAPFSYWQRGQDLYSDLITNVDTQIGRVLGALPQNVLNNTVVVFLSDHGDYGGAHGFAQNKVGTVYEETLHIPFIVRDYTGQFAGDVNTMRSQLTSNVDVLRLLVDLGHGGSNSWMTGDLQTLYGTRHDLLSVVRSATASGRTYACFTTDEYVKPIMNFNLSPTHIIGVMQDQLKLGVYNFWYPQTTTPMLLGGEAEFYDHATTGGALELDNQPNDPRAAFMLYALFSELLPNEIRRPLPASLQTAQAQAEQAYLQYVSVLDTLASDLKSNFGLGLDG